MTTGDLGNGPASQHAHINTHAFTELLRFIDATASQQGSQKRKRPAAGEQVERASLSIADWAKARAELRLQGRRHNPRNSKSGKVGGKATPREIASATYSPFSKADLLQRIATFSLSTYAVKVRIHAMVTPLTRDPHKQQSLALTLTLLAHWLEPVGPALHGWRHAPPPSGARNRLVCATCSAEHTVPDVDVEAVAQLIDSVQRLQVAHLDWCPWRRRPCDPRTYSLGGVARAPADGEERYVVRATSRHRARKCFLDLCSDMQTAIAALESRQPVRSPASLEPDVFRELQAALQQTAELSSASSLETTLQGQGVTDVGISLDALLLALYGWVPAHAGASAKSILTCSFCNRKVNVARAAGAIDPEQEHRSYCPWINSDTQGGQYFLLPAIPQARDLPETDVSGETTTSLEEYFVHELERMSKEQSNMVASVGRLDLPSSSPVSASGSRGSDQGPGWLRVAHKLIDRKDRGLSLSGKTPDGVLCSDRDLETPGRNESRESDYPSPANPISKRKTSEILREAKVLLYGLKADRSAR
ncbi:unnamed protein product [Parajaminaea phylloscopi]